MSRADEKEAFVPLPAGRSVPVAMDVDPEAAGLVAFHRGRAAGHRRAFLDAMDLLQGAAARAADAEAELAELRAEASALRQRLQNDTAAHRDIAGKLGQQVAEAQREAEKHQAKVQQLLGEQHAKALVAKDDAEALHCCLDQAGVPQADPSNSKLMPLVERIYWLSRQVQSARQDKEAAELARVEAERERDEAIARADGAEAELRELRECDKEAAEAVMDAADAEDADRRLASGGGA